MNRKLSTVALAAILAGAGLTGCGGTGGANSPSTALVTAAVRSSTQEAMPDAKMDDEHERDAAVASFLALLNDLRQVPQLAPLFDLYQVPNPVVVVDDDVSAGLVQLLHAVKITVSSGTVTISNRATGGVIYSAPLADLASGVFHPENLPAATTTPPTGGTCTSFTYSAWGACQPDGTQARTVLGSSPAGCTGGTPATTQACTYVPPTTTCTSFTYSAWGACQPDGTQARTVLGSSPAGCTGGTPATSQACTYTPPPDGAALYGTYCAGCHGPLASSNLKGRNISVSLIKSFNMTQGLTDAQLQAIVTAVGP